MSKKYKPHRGPTHPKIFFLSLDLQEKNDIYIYIYIYIYMCVCVCVVGQQKFI